MKILIIDDEQPLLKLYSVLLAKEGIEVAFNTEGNLAFQRVKEMKPNLVLLNLMLPKKNGFDVLVEIKKDPETKNIPVIIFSNLSQATDIAKAKDLGAVDYIVKPNVPLAEVITIIKNNVFGKVEGN
ncbi:MAG: response regulator [Parcubacteria group bacterium]|nr:response regulator [Parcubacteria group bacterium]